MTRGRFWRDTARRYARNRPAVAGAFVVLLVVGGCLLVPVVSPHDPYALDFAQASQRPSAEHPLGTDLFGRDLFTRMALGGRTTFLVASGAVALILLIGLVYGIVAGVAGGRVDELMMRVLDGLLALPRLPVMIVILVFVGLRANLLTLVFALAIVNWMVTEGIERGRLYLVVLPSAAIGLVAVAANFVADGLHDALDPRRTA